MPKTIVPLCLAALLSACGQTGALYLPEKGPPKHHSKSPPVKVVKPGSADDQGTPQTAPATTPATTTDSPTPTEPKKPDDDDTSATTTPAQ
ncbi:MAG: lipoprotein [Solimonas sp.]